VGPGASSKAEEGPPPSAIGNPPPHRKPGRKIKHGFYAQQPPVGELEAVLAENIEGLEQEIEGLRHLNQELFEMFDLAESNQELARLLEVSGRSEVRLATLVRARKELAERARKGDEEAELRARLEKLARDLGSSLEAWGAPGTGRTGDIDLARGIAMLRLTLRRILAQVEASQDINDRVRYTDMYGLICIKLARLLKVQATGERGLFIWWREALDEALEGVVEELGLKI
jgi:hypothetical protein